MTRFTASTPAATSTLLRPPRSAQERTERLAQLVSAFKSSAVDRDRAGGHAASERELIRASGLLNLTTPLAHGGSGASWVVFYDTLRELANADSALAHLFAFHHLQVVSLLLFGSPGQQQRLLTQTVEHSWFWGNALNPNDKRAVAVEEGGGYLITGPKSYCSGSVGSDHLTFTAWHEGTQSFLIGVVPSTAPGLTIQQDWDAFGQKQTDSGTVHFERVRVPLADVLIPPGTPATPQTTLRAQFAQLILTHLYLGIAEGALNEARSFALDFTRPWGASGVARSADDPYVQHRFAELHLLVRPARLLSEHAARLLDAAYQQGDRITAQTRGEVAIAVAEAKVLSHRAAMEVSSKLFEITGARSTSQRYGLDRYWRNARVHTLHDPIDYKLRDIGRHVLEGRLPEPTSYS